MGLDTTHGAWHGSYSSFASWRRSIAKHYDVPLDLMEGFWSPEGATESLIKSAVGNNGYLDKYKKVLPIKWEVIKIPHCIKALLNHSDCDGHLTPSICGKLSKELFKIAPIVKSVDSGFSDEYIRGKTISFAEGCKCAFYSSEKLEFR